MICLLIYDLNNLLLKLMYQISLLIPFGLNIIISSYYAITNIAPLLLVSPVFHTLSLYYTSFCSRNHCHISSNFEQFRKAPEECQYCQVPKRLRMKHCKRCKKCIHKFDHHCLLMGLCIGEFNQKYYVGFLWFHLYNCFCLTVQLWNEQPQYVTLDQNAIQHISWKYFFLAIFLMFIVVNLIIAVHLSIQHTYFMLTNQTTYENFKKQELWYIKDANTAPFSEGVCNNLIQVLKANQNKAIDWEQKYFLIRLNENNV